MSNSILQRIINEKKQIKYKEKLVIKEADEFPTEQEDLSEPIQPEKLKEKLLKKLNPTPQIIMNDSEQVSEFKIELVHFTNLHEFVGWYENNKDKFSEKQNGPLNSLIEARDMTLGGCNCDREKRKIIAEDYFRKFWINNQKTDLLSTLQKILNSKKIIFGDFLVFPS
jgi:hypothetical protein